MFYRKCRELNNNNNKQANKQASRNKKKQKEDELNFVQHTLWLIDCEQTLFSNSSDLVRRETARSLFGLHLSWPFGNRRCCVRSL